MKAILLSIGDELLIGKTLNTNVNWIAQQLNIIGVDVIRMVTLSDQYEDIYYRLDNAIAESNIVLITGGLGPTSDDITKDVLIKYFSSEVDYDERALANIEEIYSRRHRTITTEIKAMALLPRNCIPIYNYMGTAPGMLFDLGARVVAAMPGVPYEMKDMMSHTVLPYLEKRFELPVIVHKHILTAAKGETEIAQKIAKIETELPKHIKLAYLPDVGKVKLRLTARGKDKISLQREVDKIATNISAVLGKDIYGYDDDVYEDVIGKILKSNHLQLVTAESCTGGYIAHLITSVAGSSEYFKGSIIAYSNEVKQKLLQVRTETLYTSGAVSEPCVSEMLSGVLRVLEGNIAIAVSGIAGPGGGSEEKPVGTVVIGIATPQRQHIKTFTFTTDRQRNIQLSTIIALEMLRRFITAEDFSGSTML